MPTEWTGRIDHEEGSEARRWHQIVQLTKHPVRGGIHLLGFASDEGVRRNHGRVGASAGPLAFRKMAANLAVHQVGELYDLGDVVCPDNDLEYAQEMYRDLAAAALTDGKVLGVGGGHEMAWASYAALRKVHPDAKIGILNIDAHLDMRKADLPTSGTPFLQAIQDHLETHYAAVGIARHANTQALFKRAKEYGALIIEDFQVASALERLEPWLAKQDVLYLSVDLDVLPGSLAPGVSAPAGRGVALEALQPIFVWAAQSGKLAIADIAELNPSHDQDARTARTAAWIAWQIVEAWR